MHSLSMGTAETDGRGGGHSLHSPPPPLATGGCTSLWLNSTNPQLGSCSAPIFHPWTATYSSLGPWGSVKGSPFFVCSVSQPPCMLPALPLMLPVTKACPNLLHECQTPPFALGTHIPASMQAAVVRREGVPAVSQLGVHF